MTDTTAPARLFRVRGALALSVLAAALGTSAANVALPTISANLGGTFAHTQWVALAYLLAMTSASLIVGHLGDRIGRRRMLGAGVLVFTAAALGAALAPTLGLLIAARAVQGIGAAVMMALPLAIARDSVPTERLGATMGMLGTTAAVGTASGPALGGALISLLGWQAIFAVMVPLGALILALLGRSDHSASTPAPPILPTTLLRTPGIAVGAVLNLIVGAVMMSTLVVGPFFLSGALGLAPAAVGAVMAAGPIASICTGMFASRAVDRFGSRAMTTTGLCAMVMGSLALALLPAIVGLTGYMIGTVLLAPGYQLFLAANNTAVLTAVPAQRRGTASGLLQLARNLGLVTGASVLASVFAVAAGSAVTEASATQLGTALQTTFLFTAAVLLCGSAVSIVGTRRTSLATRSD